VARHIFQAFPVWIYTQSNITQACYPCLAIDSGSSISENIRIYIQKRPLHEDNISGG
jgi:hypothetical protein